MAIECYSAAGSVYAGDSLVLCGRSTLVEEESFTIRIYRIGQSETQVHEGVGRAPLESVPPEAHRSGCHWPTIYTVEVLEEWRSGAYVARLTAQAEEVTKVSFVVKRSRTQSAAQILVVFPVATEQAYNIVFGHSLYDFYNLNVSFSERISFDRPGDWHADLNYGRILAWLEGFAPEADFATSLDLHGDPALLERYTLLVCLAHDEYWSKEMRDNVEAFIHAGKNVCFFTGNTCWWQVRFEDGGRTIVCYKSADTDPEPNRALATDNWYRSPAPGRPENSLTGVSSRHAGLTGPPPFPDTAFVVRRADHWVFQGTGLENGDTFGGKDVVDDGGVPRLAYDQVVGHECDGAIFNEIGGVPVATGEGGTPDGFTILATADLANAGATLALFDINGNRAVLLVSKVSRQQSLELEVVVEPDPADSNIQDLSIRHPPSSTVETFSHAVADVRSLITQINDGSTLVRALLIFESLAALKTVSPGAEPQFGVFNSYVDGVPLPSAATMGIYQRQGIVFTASTTYWLGAGTRLNPEEWNAVSQISVNVLRRLRWVGIPPGSPVAALARDPGKLDIWVTDGDGQVYRAFYDEADGRWSGWRRVAGPVPGGLPAGAPVTAISRGAGMLDVWVTGRDGHVYTAFYNDAGALWDGWHRVSGRVPGGVRAGAPVAVLARGPGMLDVWVTGGDGRVYTAFYNDAGALWDGWYPVSGPVPGGVPAGAPVAVLARGPGMLDVWVTGGDGHVYTAFYNDAGVPWDGWHRVSGRVPGGVPAGAPVTVLARGPGILDAWVTSGDGHVYTAFCNDADVLWDGWYRVSGPVPGGIPAGAPVTVLARGPGMLDVWVTGGDGHVYTAFYNDAGVPWDGWHPVSDPVPGGVPAGAPVTVLARGPGMLDAWVTGGNSNVWTCFYNDAGAWDGWYLL